LRQKSLADFAKKHIHHSCSSDLREYPLTLIEQKLQNKTSTKCLWMALYFPSLPLLATGQHCNNNPVAICEKIDSDSTLIFANTAAQIIGVNSGMLSSEIDAFRPHIQILERNRKKEKAIIEQLSVIANDWSPTVVVKDNLILLLEIGSTLRSHNGLTPLTKLIKQSIPSEIEDYHMAITPTPESAKLCVMDNRNTYLVTYAQLVSHIRNISVNKIELSKQQYKFLFDLGIKTIGDLFRLPRSGIIQRFGFDFLNYIERLTGKAIDPRPLSKSRPLFYADIDLEGEITTIQQLLAGIRILLVKLEQHLNNSYAAINQLEWYLYYENNSYEKLSIGLNQLQRNFVSLYNCSQLALRSLSLSDVIVNIALYVRPQTISQLDNVRFLTAVDETKKHDFLDRLCARIGNHAINGICCKITYKPEAAWAYCIPSTNSCFFSVGARPFLLFETPRLLATKDTRPYFHGPLKLSKCERIVTNWWDKHTVNRDYYVARSNCGLLWVFRDICTKRWYIHGRF
tara:strand:+ start:1536 stop:3074 length:1539 start_codon:yes stop_codon:yes gene_type:complete